MTGRIILANMPVSEVVGLYESYSFKTFTESTVSSLGALLVQLEKDREQASLISWGYFEPNIASIAAPVYNRGSAVEAAVIATCPIDTYPRDVFESEMRRRTERAAEDISQALGHRPNAG